MYDERLLQETFTLEKFDRSELQVHIVLEQNLEV